MKPGKRIDRREFLRIGAAAGGGLLVAFCIDRSIAAPGRRTGAASASADTGPFSPNAFVRIGTDETVTIVANHSEMGQGVYTSIAMLVADELEADWSKVRVESAPIGTVYNHPFMSIQMTGGSSSTRAGYRSHRAAGAAARMMLVAAAAERWRADVAECRAENGRVVHAPSGRTLSYGQLAERAAQLPPPSEPALKDPKDFKLIGRSTKRVDARGKIDGTAVFGIDVRLPGMLVAVVARPPVFGAKLVSFDDSKARAVAGVRHVAAIDAGVAVVADGFWAAKRGRDALEVIWDEGPLARLDTAEQLAAYENLSRKPGALARNDGDARGVLAAASQTIEATFELPYLAHAPMEPLNCAVDLREDGCNVWTGTQFQTLDWLAAAEVAGLPPDKVKFHTTLLGGAFGRRAVADSHFVREAVQVAKHVRKPVKVVWTREDDIRGGYYRPRALHRISASLDGAGGITAWEQHVVCQTFMHGTPFAQFVFRDGVDGSAVEGAADLPYRVPNVRLEWHEAPGGVPTLWWRSVGHSHTAFAVECFIDELARAADRDPLEFRLGLLPDHPRHREVLKLAAEKSGWTTPPPAGRARGIAVHASFDSIVAHVAEVSVEDGRLRVHRVVCAVDCGPVVNPDGVRAQMESSIVFGLSAALHGEITFADGRVQQSNFHDYPVLRLNEMPAVEVHIAPPLDHPMGGAGEPGTPPIAPAVANALAALTGRPVRRLPIRLDA